MGLGTSLLTRSIKGDVKRDISPTTGSWAKIRLGIQPPWREFLMRRPRSASALGLPGSECVPSLQIQSKGVQPTAGRQLLVSSSPFPSCSEPFCRTAPTRQRYRYVHHRGETQRCRLSATGNRGKL
jgi:hypothetical protein